MPWLDVKEIDLLSYYIPETLLFTMYIYIYIFLIFSSIMGTLFEFRNSNPVKPVACIPMV